MAAAVERGELTRTSVEQFVELTGRLLSIERNEEVNEAKRFRAGISLKEQEKMGVCLLRLKASNVHSGLYGRIIVVFESSRRTKDRSLPANKLSCGDIVSLQDSSGCDVASGVVTRKRETAITVAFEDSPGSLMLHDERQYRLIRQSNDITYRRLKMALQCLSKLALKGKHPLVEIMFNGKEIHSLRTHPPDGDDDMMLFNTMLDCSQCKAVSFALARQDMAIIHGPPGTGKTTTLVEIILQVVKKGSKVLACAPSNVAVDNLVERLATATVKVVRLGHPARLSSSVHSLSLDALLTTSEQMGLVKDVRKEIDTILQRKYKMKDKVERGKLTNEIKLLRKEIRDREQRAIREVLEQADVVLSTNTSASTEGPLRYLKTNHFDLVVIDEASQALEASCWIPLIYSSRCVLAGDHHQLPPTILSDKAAREGLSLTLMKRAIDLCGNDNLVCMLTHQYRMNEVIMGWASDQLYDSLLTAHESVRHHLLRELPGVSDLPITSIPLLLIDTAGCNQEELETSEEMSKGNEGEANIVACHVGNLIEAGVQPLNIAVITPYNLQVEMIRSRLIGRYPSIEISSVDAFQGREKEAVVLSLVRSNKKGEFGFLADYRRINVAVTRARRHLAVVADSDTVGRNEFIKQLIEYIGFHGEVWSANEYIVHETVSNEDVEAMNIEAAAFVGAREQVQPGAKCFVNPPAEDQASSNETAVDTGEGNQQERTSSHNVLDRDQVAAQVDMFLKSEPDQLAFDPSLSAQERFLVHELAEQHSLIHYSRGEGKHRQIIIEKRKKLSVPVKPSVPMIRTKSSKLGGEVAVDGCKFDGSKFVDISLARKQCCHCNRLVPVCNVETHKAKCSRERKATMVQKSQKVKKQSSMKDTVLPLQLDDDELLNSVIESKNVCSYSNCKERVTLTGQQCRLCRCVYCLKHCIPEIHGCGDDAKVEARKEARHLHHQQNSISSVTTKQYQRHQLQEKLHKMKEKRSRKERAK